MKYHNYLLALIFLFFISIKTYSQVTVEYSNVKVNNVLINQDPINFNGAASLNITGDIKLKTLNGNSSNTFGNVFVYTKEMQSSYYPIQRNSQAVTFTVTYPPFVPQPTYTSISTFSINVNINEFFASGGYLYISYVNNNNDKYNSVTIPILGGSRTSSPVDNLPNSICCDQTIRYGDKPAIIYGGSVNPSVGVMWHGNGVLYNNYAVDDINSFDPGYLIERTVYGRVLGNTHPYKKSNSVVINIVQSPILSNDIQSSGVNISPNIYEIYEGENLNLYGANPKVNLNILADPNHTNGRTDEIIDVDGFQWQYSQYYPYDFRATSDGTLGNGTTGIKVKKWYDIPGATSGALNGYTGPESSPKHYYVRRIAKYQNISRVSNELEVIVNGIVESNVICCSQIYESSSSPMPQILTGSLPVFDNSKVTSGYQLISYTFSYQWQSQSRSGAWTDISGATNKDYFPPTSVITRAGTQFRRKVTFNFSQKRIVNNAIINSNYFTYSNTVNWALSGIRPRALNKDLKDKEVEIYPNPVSSFFIVEGMEMKRSKISINDLSGKTFIPKVDVIDDNIANIDISNLASGVYYVVIQNNASVIRKKIIKK